MSDRRRALLRELVEKTGEPPGEGSDPEVVLEAAQAMLERRTDVIETLRALGPIADASSLEPEWRSLGELEDRWTNAIVLAQKEISDRIEALRRAPRAKSRVEQSLGARRRV